MERHRDAGAEPAAGLDHVPDGARLPVGVMLAARPAEEPLLLSLAAQVEEAVGGFADQHPPGW